MPFLSLSLRMKEEALEIQWLWEVVGRHIQNRLGNFSKEKVAQYCCALEPSFGCLSEFQDWALEESVDVLFPISLVSVTVVGK